MRRIAQYVLLLLALGATGAAAQTQTNASPPCQYPPSAVQGGSPSSCGYIFGYIDGSGKFQQVDASHGLPVLPSGVSAVVATDKGGTVATGGTSQTAVASNSSRKGCWVQNPVNATEDLFVSSTASATTTAGSPNDADLAPGGEYTCNVGGTVVTSAIRVNAATTGHAYIAKEVQ